MKKFILLPILFSFSLACERETMLVDSEDNSCGTIIFSTTVESGYEATDNSINSWLIIDGVTYNAQCAYIEPYESIKIDEKAFIDMDSGIMDICIKYPEIDEIIDTRIESGITYNKYKIQLPISYNGFNFSLYYLEERAFVNIAGNNYWFPSPSIQISLANDDIIKQADMNIDGKSYNCYLVNFSIYITYLEKTICCKTSFLALDEKNIL